MPHGLDVAIIFVITAALMLVSTWRSTLRREACRERAGQLDVARAWLAEQAQALKKFLDDPAADGQLGDLLRRFAIAAADPGAVRAIRMEILAGGLPQSAGDGRGLRDRVQALNVTRPELAEAFQRAVQAGLHAMFLRFDDIAADYAALVAGAMGTPLHAALWARRVGSLVRQPDAASSMSGPIAALN